jgi:hypothetical protein
MLIIDIMGIISLYITLTEVIIGREVSIMIIFDDDRVMDQVIIDEQIKRILQIDSDHAQ